MTADATLGVLDHVGAAPAPAPASTSSPARAAAGGAGLRQAASATLPLLTILAVLLGAWQLAVTAGVKPPQLLPAPLDVGRVFLDELRAGVVIEVVATSLGRAALGFAISLPLGSALGLAMARLRPLRRAIGPLLAGLQSLPSVAWVPFALLWFGVSGSAITFVVVLGALPSIANGLLHAIDGVPPLLLRVGDALGARGLARLRHVVLPAALPGYMAGLRQAWAFSWRSLMAAELIAQGSGLGMGMGQLLHHGQERNDMRTVIVAILLILAVGVAVELGVFAPLDRGIRRRRGLLAD